MAQKIALISAFPTNTNPGMLSVELGFANVEKILGDEYTVARFSTEQSFELQAGSATYKWEYLSDPVTLRQFDKIVYWGDFLQWRGYNEGDWMVRQTKRFPDIAPEKLRDQWYGCHLLEGHADLQRKAVLFGGTLYGLSARDLADERYRKALTELCRDAQSALFRDQLSSGYIAQLLHTSADYYGCDCAFLLDTAAFDVPPRTSPPKVPEKYLLYSFERSGAGEASAVFARQLAGAMGLPAVQFRWLGHRSGVEGLFRKLEVVRTASAVVTDVYHLSLSAFRERRPLLALGLGSSYANRTLADKKKEVFFRQIFAEPYYVYVENVVRSQNNAAARKQLLDACAANLRDTAMRDFIHKEHEEHVTRSKERLLAALKK